MTIPTIDALPPYPVRGEPREDFATKANATVAAMPTLVTQINAAGVAMNDTGTTIAAAETAALSAANFSGEWSTLTGALAIPVSVSHNDTVWLLKESLADVTASEPGVTADWIRLYGGVDTSLLAFRSVVGRKWAERANAAGNSWSAVCWSPELKIAVQVGIGGTGNRVQTSQDGITWTARTSAADNSWSAVCWSPDLTLFVAVAGSGTGNRVMTSPDGITWTIRTSSGDNLWKAVCWSPQLTLFVAVAGTGITDTVMTSPDGINWTGRTGTGNAEGIAWSPELSLFVAVGGSVETSPDGINWTSRTHAETSCVAVCWSPYLSQFVAVGTNKIQTSIDGINWTSRTAPTGAWTSVCWSDDLLMYVAVGGSSVIMTSTDGITWATRPLLVGTHPLSGVTWCDDLFAFIASSNDTGSNTKTLTSAIW